MILVCLKVNMFSSLKVFSERHCKLVKKIGFMKSCKLVKKNRFYEILQTENNPPSPTLSSRLENRGVDSL